MTLYLQAVVTVLSLIGPVMCAAIFSGIESGRSPTQRLVDASKAALAILVILELSALFGVAVLNLLGISLDVFSVAGGSVLVWMGFTMLRGATAESHGNSSSSSSSSSLTPVILFAASPGTITGVITLSVAHSGSELPVTALTAVAVATLITWLMLVLAARGNGKTGGGGLVRPIVQSLMGLILMAMGMQFGLTGLSTFITGAGG